MERHSTVYTCNYIHERFLNMLVKKQIEVIKILAHLTTCDKEEDEAVVLKLFMI